MHSAPHVTFLVDSTSRRSSMTSEYASDSSRDSLALDTEPEIKLHRLLTRSLEPIRDKFNYRILWDITEEPRYAQYIMALDTHERLHADDWNAAATEPAVQVLKVIYLRRKDHELIVRAKTNAGITIAELFMALYDHFRCPGSSEQSTNKTSQRVELAHDKRTANVDRSNRAPQNTELSKGDEMMRYTRFAGMDIEPGRKCTVRLTLKGRDGF